MSTTKKAQATHAEKMVKTCAGIVAELIEAHNAGVSVNLNTVKSKHSRENKLSAQPRLVDIIAAIPE
ncbi:Elongator subunit, partial [Linderina macrospora]